jgi:hypothetical protein
VDQNPYSPPQVPAPQVSAAQGLPWRPHYGLAALGLGGIVFWIVMASVAYDAIMGLHAKPSTLILAEIVGSIVAGVALCIAFIWWAFRRGIDG